MALLDCCDQLTFADRLDVWSTIGMLVVVFICWWTTITSRQIGDDVFVTLTRAEFV
jgi:hypothetical protein